MLPLILAGPGNAGGNGFAEFLRQLSTGMSTSAVGNFRRLWHAVCFGHLGARRTWSLRWRRWVGLSTTQWRFLVANSYPMRNWRLPALGPEGTQTYSRQPRVSFLPVIHLITNDDWRNMAQCSIIELSPPTPPRIGFNPPSVGGFFLAKILVSGDKKMTYSA